MLDHARPTLELQLRLCYQSFMRLREMLHLHWDRVDLKVGRINLRAEDVKTGSRTGEGREFYVNEEILSQLKIRRSKMPKAVYVFQSPKDPSRPAWNNRSAWRRLKRKVGIEGRARWHDLRHTALTRALVERKENPLLVSKYAGVSMRTIERVYLHVRPEDTKAIGSCIEV